MGGSSVRTRIRGMARIGARNRWDAHYHRQSVSAYTCRTRSSLTGTVIQWLAPALKPGRQKHGTYHKQSRCCQESNCMLPRPICARKCRLRSRGGSFRSADNLSSSCSFLPLLVVSSSFFLSSPPPEEQAPVIFLVCLRACPGKKAQKTLRAELLEAAGCVRAHDATSN